MKLTKTLLLIATIAITIGSFGCSNFNLMDELNGTTAQVPVFDFTTGSARFTVSNVPVFTDANDFFNAGLSPLFQGFTTGTVTNDIYNTTILGETVSFTTTETADGYDYVLGNSGDIYNVEVSTDESSSTFDLKEGYVLSFNGIQDEIWTTYRYLQIDNVNGIDSFTTPFTVEGYSHMESTADPAVPTANPSSSFIMEGYLFKNDNYIGILIGNQYWMENDLVSPIDPDFDTSTALAVLDNDLSQFTGWESWTLIEEVPTLGSFSVNATDALFIYKVSSSSPDFTLSGDNLTDINTYLNGTWTY